jgi:quercetin dioxygenase-like cupin family protein
MVQELGPIGSCVLFENDAIRVWAVSVEPGSKQPWHRHLLPHLTVPLTGGEIEIESADGTLRRPKEVIGQVVWREPGDVHELRNVGASHYRNVLVEVKTPAGSP